MIPEPSDWWLGVALACLAALGFAGQFLFVRLGTVEGDVNDAVFIALACNVVLLAPPVVILYPPPYTQLFTPTSALAFAAAGLIGMFAARILLFTSVGKIGANLTAPIISSNVLFATVIAVVALGERLSPQHALGILLVVVGVAVVSWETADAGPDRSLRDTGAMLTLPLGAAIFIGIEPTLISVGLGDGTPVLPGILLMAMTASIAFLCYLFVVEGGPSLPDSSRSTGWFVAAGVSTTVGFVGYFAGLSLAPVVLVVPLIQLAPLIVVVVSLIALPRHLERITWQVGFAAVVVVVGATLVSLSG